MTSIDDSGIPDSATITKTHQNQTINTKEPTCLADGYNGDIVCSRCGQTFSIGHVIPALGHSGAVTKPADEPTSGAAGKTAEITCTRCGFVIQQQQTIPALGYVRNVTARQLWPHKKVEICYDLADDIGEVSAADAVPTLTARYGSLAKTAQTVLGDTSCTPGHHAVVWDFEADGIAISQSEVTFSVSYPAGGGSMTSLATPGLSVKYYDISSSGYSTWTQSEAAMTNYFVGKTPTLEANTIDWGDTLQSGFQQNDVGSYFANYPDLWLDRVSTNRYHGKYANQAQNNFAMLFEGFLQVDVAGTHSFAAACDDAVVLYVDGTKIVASSAWQQTPPTKSISLSKGMHRISIATYENGGSQGMWVEWKTPGASSYTALPQSVLFRPNSGVVGGSASGNAVTTGSGTVVSSPSGLTVKYYDITSSGYSTWTQSEAAMKSYFGGMTPTIEANSIDWGDGLDAGFTSLPGSSVQSSWRSAGLTIPPQQCKFHGKYANASTKGFAAFMTGFLRIDTAGTYQFAGVADDTVVLYVNGQMILKNEEAWERLATGECVLAAGYYPVSIAFREQNTTGGQGFSVQWKKPGDSSYSPIPQSVLFEELTVLGSALGFVEGSSAGIAVNTSSSVKDGMSVSGTVALGYSPFRDGEATLLVDGATMLSSTNSGSFAWMPQTTGTHTLKHVSGSYTWTRTVNVTSLAYYVEPLPNPPTSPDSNISISSTTKSFGTGGGSGSIVTSGSGTWTATASADWITIPEALTSRNAGLPVVYQVAANSGVESRTGYIYVSGHVFTVTQAGVGASLDRSSASFETDGGMGSFTVLADAQSSWRVKSDVDWITVAAVSGTGEDDVSYTVAPFNEVSTRSGTITAAGCTFTVNQTGRRMKIAVSGAANAARPVAERDYQSHVIDVQVNALSSTTWDVEPDSSWISVVDAGSGHGGDNVAIAINENPSWLARSGSVRIGTEILGIRQTGRPSAALAFSISPESTTASVRGANGVISVMSTPDLPWTAQSHANWLTVMPDFQAGAGNGNVVYTASPNPTMAGRTGTITVAATSRASLSQKTHTVSQPAATASVSSTSHAFNSAGESFGVDVAVDDVVNWTVVENVAWISIAGDTSRIGPGTVTVSAAGNPTVEPRSASLTIAGHTFSATQKGRSVTVEYESRVFGTETDYETLDVHPDGNATWTAVSSAPDWLTIWGGEGCTTDQNGNVTGTGDNTIEYIVADYVGDGSPRTATITIGDKTVFITQRAYELSINPSATWVSGNAGSGSVGVPATAGQVWNAIATEPWITIASGTDTGTGSGTVRFTYTDNDTGEERTGRIVIAGETYNITQAARQMVTVSARVEGGKGLVSGTGTYDRGTSVALRATASDGYEFLNWTLPNGTTRTGASLSVTADVDKEIVANFRRIPYYDVNGESVREGTSKTFTAPNDILDAAGTTKLVCRGTSRYPDKGRSFTLVVTEDISFEWDLWTTNYLVSVSQSSNGTIKRNGSTAGNFWVAAGSTVDLTATPKSGKTFFRWNVESGSPGGLAPPDAANAAGTPLATLSLCVDRPLTVSAVFGVFDDTLAEALDAPALAFTTGGDASWTPVVDATAQTGYTSARSGTGGADADTWLDLTLEGAGTLTFRWRVDCEKDDGGEATWDRLAVFANGLEISRIDGKTDWETVTIPVTGSKTTIRWSFYRDDFDEPGQTHENAGWVDGVNFTAEGL